MQPVLPDAHNWPTYTPPVAADSQHIQNAVIDVTKPLLSHAYRGSHCRPGSRPPRIEVRPSEGSCGPWGGDTGSKLVEAFLVLLGA